MLIKSQKSNRNSQNFLEEVVAKKRLDFIQKTRKTQIVRKIDYQRIRKEDSVSFINSVIKNNKKIGLIAEIKFASPTNSHLGSPDVLLERAKIYEQLGASAISLITEKHFFKGDISFVSQVKKQVAIPVLQKDFVIDPKQIFEANRIGSDALLLIARLVDTRTLKQFVDLCFSLRVEPVVEIANEEDLVKAMATNANIIAVNARDLESLEIDIVQACSLIKTIPDRYIKLGFSGIHTAKEVQLYKDAGVAGVLVGTSLMQANNIPRFITELAL